MGPAKKKKEPKTTAEPVMPLAKINPNIYFVGGQLKLNRLLFIFAALRSRSKVIRSSVTFKAGTFCGFTFRRLTLSATTVSLRRNTHVYDDVSLRPVNIVGRTRRHDGIVTVHPQAWKEHRNILETGSVRTGTLPVDNNYRGVSHTSEASEPTGRENKFHIITINQASMSTSAAVHKLKPSGATRRIWESNFDKSSGLQLFYFKRLI